MCGEGGAFLFNNEWFVEQAEIIREKGTNRSKFFRGEVDKYTWVALGSSFLPGDLVAAFLYAQLEMADAILAARNRLCQRYIQGLQGLAEKKRIRLPFMDSQGFSGQSMYVITGSLEERNGLIEHLLSHGIKAVFHYVPLHTSPMGCKHCRTHGDMTNTVQISERLVRLPLYNDMQDQEVRDVVEEICKYFDV